MQNKCLETEVVWSPHPQKPWTKLHKVKENTTYFICCYYNPKSEKVGTVWKTQIKKESSDF